MSSESDNFPPSDDERRLMNVAMTELARQCDELETENVRLRVALLSIYEGGHDAAVCRKAGEAIGV